jgi:membrane-bound serine protease (ClpP class)
VPVAALITICSIVVVIAIYFVAIWTLRTYRKQVAAGREELVGKIATVKVALAPKGVVLVEGERWDAAIDKGRAEPEEEVIITRVDGLKLTVTKKQ